MINTDWARTIPLPKTGWEYLPTGNALGLSDDISLSFDDGTRLYGYVRMRTRKGIWVEWDKEISEGRLTYFKRKAA